MRGEGRRRVRGGGRKAEDEGERGRKKGIQEGMNHREEMVRAAKEPVALKKGISLGEHLLPFPPRGARFHLERNVLAKEIYIYI